MNAKIDRL